MRLLILSNAPFAGTGYGVQTALLARGLRDAGHECAILAYWGLEGARLDFEGIPVFPRSRHPASQDFMVPLAAQLNCQAVISITDAWVIETQRFAGSDLAHVPWFPVDGDPMDQENARGIAGPGPKVTLPVATSNHAAAMARARGITDLRTIHYMVDRTVYRPGGSQAEDRDFWGIPTDAFIVGIVAMNKAAAGVDRKRFFEQIGAFAAFRKNHPDALLYMHSHMMAPDGVAIQEIVAHHKLPPEALLATNGFVLTCGAQPDQMAALYRSFDVLLGVTGGEGAGMPHLEAAACGTPSIWGEWTAMPEYAKAGWKVEANEAQQQMNMGRVLWQVPRIDAIADRLEQAYDASDRDRKVLSERAVTGSEDHDALKVVPDKWIPALAEVDRRLEESERVTSVPIPDVLRPEFKAAVEYDEQVIDEETGETRADRAAFIEKVEGRA